MTSNNTTTSIDCNLDDVKALYIYYIPPILVLCLISVVINVKVLLSVHWIRRPIPITLSISLSLAVSDTMHSVALCCNLVIGSYIGKHYPNLIPFPIPEALELFRLTCILVIVLHLLALSINHYFGILKPFYYVSIMTPQKIYSIIVLLWLLPTLFHLIYFFTVLDNFEKEFEDHLNTFSFRLIISTIICVTFILMVIFHTHIIVIIREQQKLWAQLSRYGSMRNRGISTNQQKKSFEGTVRATYTTILIIGSCTMGWIPVLIIYFTICKEGCVYTPKQVKCEIGSRAFLFMNWLSHVFLILKTLINPIIYSARMVEIKEGTRRMHLAFHNFCCISKKEPCRSAPATIPLQCDVANKQNGISGFFRLTGNLSTRNKGRYNVQKTFV